MIVKFERIDDFCNKLISFYTVMIGERDIPEFAKFEDKDFNKPEHLSELQIIYNTIDKMMSKGAKKHYFKHERNADAIPIVPQELMDANKDDLGIRLYCIRINDELVILLNGDIKTHIDPLQCPNVRAHFITAVNIAGKIDKAIIEKEIKILEPGSLEGFKFEI